MSLYPEESVALTIFVARRVLDAEIAVSLVGETFAQALLRPRRLRVTSRQESVGRLYAMARGQVDRFIADQTLALPTLRRLGLSPPQLDDSELKGLEELAGISAVRSRAQPYLDDLPPDERDALRALAGESRSYPAAARKLGVTEPQLHLLSSQGLRRVADRLDARNAPLEAA